MRIEKAERLALIWLLKATDNGELISGAGHESVAILRGLSERLARDDGEIDLEIGQVWITPSGRKREILKINPKSVLYRERWGGNDFTSSSRDFPAWIVTHGAKLGNRGLGA